MLLHVCPSLRVIVTIQNITVSHRLFSGRLQGIAEILHFRTLQTLVHMCIVLNILTQNAMLYGNGGSDML